MSEQWLIHQMENWGYYLLPRSHPHSPGHSGLLVAIRETPTEMHFDPESMRLRLVDEHDGVDWVTLSLQWFFRGSRRVFPGRVILRDRTDKRVEFFAFGGSLEVTHIPGETVYSLQAPAPILEITGPLETIPDQLAFETEVLLGEMEARWRPNEEQFTQRVTQVDPLEFYTASIQSILVRYRQSQPLRDMFCDLYDALVEEKDRLMKAAQWPATPHTLEELLQPD